MTTSTSTPALVRRYKQGALLPSLTVQWYDGPAQNAALVAFGSIAHTWSLKISKYGNTKALVTKTTGITGADTAPNVTIDWSAGEIDTLAPGEYSVQLVGTRTSDSKPRFCPQEIRIIIDPVMT